MGSSLNIFSISKAALFYLFIFSILYKATGTCLLTLVGHTDLVRAMDVFSYNRIVSGSFDTTVKIWDTERGLCIQTLTGHKHNVLCVKALPGLRLASGSYQEIKVWTLNAEGNYTSVNSLVGHSHWVTCMVLLSDGVLVSGSSDKVEICLTVGYIYFFTFWVLNKLCETCFA